MSQVFPYGITLQEGGALAVFPAAEVSFHTIDGDWISLFLIVDSGATISALPKGDAQILGIEIKAGEPITVGGISGESLYGWRHEITVGLGIDEIRIPVVFFDHDDTPRVLGRAGVFDHFTIVFEETKRRSGFIDEASVEAENIHQLINALG